MQYNVAQLLLEPTGATRSYSVQQAHEGSSGTSQGAQSAQGTVHMLRTHQGILVHAMLDVETSLNCGRCLSDYRRASFIDIEEEFIPSVDLHTGRNLAAGFDDGADFHIDGDHVLDLTDAVRQYAIADEPMKPLCHQDCSGLCHSCGANLNRTHCRCQRGAIDPRWTVLAELGTPDDH